jgi:predicted ATPase/class 3 adenylate cyclase
MVCPNCGFESQASLRFCGRCGIRLALICPSCDYANPPDFLFCGMCGNPLPGEADQGVLPEYSPVEKGATRQKPAAELKLPEAIEGERRVATVVMADVSRSSDLLEKIGTEAWVGIMNRVFQLLNGEVYRFGGVVDQFRGDGLVAFFGTVVAHEDDPERGVLAALAMQQAISHYAASLIGEKGIDIKLRIGVNTGNVIVASVGDASQHQEDTAMGEAITLAARLEAEAEPGTVLASENTYRLSENRFHWQPLGQIAVKGISHPVIVYRPLSPRFDFEATPDLQAYGMPIKLTGREAEYEKIKDAINGLYQGRGEIVLVVGEKGLGKTLLITQVRQHFNWIEATIEEPRQAFGGGVPSEKYLIKNTTWLQSVCRSYDQAWPFSMWKDLLYKWLGMRPDQPPEERSEQLLAQSQRLWGDSYTRYFPYLAKFLSIPTVKPEFEDKLRYLDAEGLKKQFFVTIRSWVEMNARLGPLVLSFTDLQWADAVSLELLKYCLPVCERQSLIWLAVFRPERTSPAWGFRYHVETEYPHRLTVVDLQPLGDHESHELIHEMIGPQALSDQVEQLILSKAEGNPYFIREIISSMINQGVLAEDPDSRQWRMVKNVTTLDLPDSLQSLLLERLDRLTANERYILQAASVMGLSFWEKVLPVLVNGNGQRGLAVPFESILTSLQRKGLIQEHSQIPGLGMEYGFNSSLVRDVIYESMLVHQREAYHEKVAVFLENCDCLENWLQHSSLIAYHYRLANNKRQEFYYTVKASQQALDFYAMTEAYEHLTRALELIDEVEHEAGANGSSTIHTNVIQAYRFDLLNDRSSVNYQLGNITEGVADARALLSLADQMPGEPHWRIDALNKQPELFFPENWPALDQGLAMAQESLDIARRLGDKDRELTSLSKLVDLQFLKHDYAWKGNAETALQLARELNNVIVQVNLLLGIGSAYGIDELETSERYLEMAIPLCQELGDKAVEMKLLRAFAEQYERKGDYYKQLTDFEQKRLQISREIGNRNAEAEALLFCGQVEAIYLGDFETGLSNLRESLRLWEGTAGSLFPLLRIAQVQIALGLYSDAEETLEAARPLVEKHVFDVGRAGYWTVSSILKNQYDDESLLRLVLEHHAAIERLVEEKLVSRHYLMAAECERSIACVKLAAVSQDRSQRELFLRQALESSGTALDIFQHFGFVQMIECTSEEIYYRHSVALDANDQKEEAGVYLDKAYDEMMRKHEMIPAYSHFRQTYLTAIPLHTDILKLKGTAVLAEIKRQPS